MDEEGSPRGRALRETRALPDLALSTELERQVWQPGETIGGVLRLTDQSATQTIRLETGSPTTGVLLDASGASTLGGFTGWIAGVGRFIELEPGDVDAVDFLAGSDAPGATRGTSPGRETHLSRSRVGCAWRA